MAEHISESFARFPNVNDNPNHNVTNDTVNDNGTYMDKKERMKAVQHTARRIADNLGEPDNIKFFYKAAWRLSEAALMNNLEEALKKDNPGAYFVTLCKLQMED